MSCFSKKSKNNLNSKLQAIPPLKRPIPEPSVDLRAEEDEVNFVSKEVKLMDYLDTHVMTKANEWSWVKRLFILN